MVYAFFALFWLPFIIRGRIDAARGVEQNGPAAHGDPNATSLVWLHSIALGMQMFAVGMATWGGAYWPFPYQAVIGAAVMVAATALAAWTLMVFRTWRIKAELTAEHELCTVGPFATIRHPIYTAMLLQCIGTAIWYPNPVAFAAILAMFIGGDLRARAEEALLLRVFGEPYAALMKRTKRVVPFVY